MLRKNDTGYYSRFVKQAIEEMGKVGMIIDACLTVPKALSTLEAIDLSSRLFVSATRIRRLLMMHFVTNPRAMLIREAPLHAASLISSAYTHSHLPNGSQCTLEDFCQMVATTADMVGVEHLGIGSDLCLNQPQAV
ncbi:dipeptidase [Vibrio chagasii]|nr:dipeptidase [Vibrio chagasii]